MIRVHWVLNDRTPPGLDWLSDRERHVLTALRFDRRRKDWLLGRWTAKQAVLACVAAPPGTRHPVDPATIAILAGDDGAPRVHGVADPVTVSISHRAGLALCVATPGAAALGCDLERVEPRSEAFVADYFTADEAARILRAPAVERPLLANLLWSCKEAALKALGVGLRRDTRCVRVHSAGSEGGVARFLTQTAGPATAQDDGWQRFTLTAELAPDTPTWLYGCWGRYRDNVLAIVCDGRFEPVRHGAVPD